MEGSEDFLLMELKLGLTSEPEETFLAELFWCLNDLTFMVNGRNTDIEQRMSLVECENEKNKKQRNEQAKQPKQSDKSEEHPSQFTAWTQSCSAKQKTKAAINIIRERPH